MLCSDLMLQILTASVLNILCLQCGAEKEIMREWNDDDLRPHFFTRHPPRWRVTLSRDDIDTRYDHKAMDTAPMIVFIVFGVFILFLFFGYYLCKSNACNEISENDSNVTVHPPPTNLNRSNNAPRSRGRPSNTRSFVSPRSSSTTLTLAPEDSLFISAFIATAITDTPPQSDTTDKPPDYASVVISDLASSVSTKYPAVRPDPVPDLSPPKYDSRNLHM